MCIERLQALVTKMEDMNRTDTDTLNDDFKFLIDCIQAIPDYFNEIVVQRSEPILLSQRFKFQDREKYKDVFVSHDKNRRAAHIAMTDSINKINRLARLYGAEPIFITGFSRELYSDANVDQNITDEMARKDRALARKLGLQFWNECITDGIVNEKSLDDSLKG